MPDAVQKLKKHVQEAASTLKTADSRWESFQKALPGLSLHQMWALLSNVPEKDSKEKLATTWWRIAGGFQPRNKELLNAINGLSDESALLARSFRQLTVTTGNFEEQPFVQASSNHKRKVMT